MERKLLDAAIQGNVAALQDLVDGDPLILDRIIISCISETPLHTAAMLGHLNFVKELLILKPELASELDSHGCSPLHLAAAKGHLDILKELLMVDPEMVWARNQDGRTPLHVAAIKGRVKVVSELVRTKPESTRVLTDRGETVLQLCVGNGRLEALRVLIEEVGKDVELVNWKDGDGNSVLHIAVAKKQTQIIKLWLSINGLDVNALNANGSTALDILTQSPRDLRDMEIEDCLGGAGALSAKDLHIISQEWIPTKVPQTTKRSVSNPSLQASKLKNPLVKHKHTDWLGRKRSALMVVASLIATVAFQSVITPPGGVWQDDLLVDDVGNPVQVPHTAGTSIMAFNQKTEYGQFMIFNTIAFLSSLSIILLLVSGLPIKRRRWMWIQMVIMWVAITAQVLTYFISLRHMSPAKVLGTLHDVTEISIIVWLCLMGVVLISNVVRMNLWVLRKFGCMKHKETVPSAAIDEDNEDV